MSNCSVIVDKHARMCRSSPAASLMVIGKSDNFLEGDGHSSTRSMDLDQPGTIYKRHVL